MAIKGLHRLSMLEIAKLVPFVKEEYPNQTSMTDAIFADYASQTLDFKINQYHVQNIRQQCEIPSNRVVKAATAKISKKDSEELICLIAGLESELRGLRLQVEDNTKNIQAMMKNSQVRRNLGV